jgi:hypothetical protein
MSDPYVAPSKRDRLFGAVCDAKTARGAVIWRNDKRLFAPMRERLDPPFEAQTSAIFLSEDTQLKNIKRTGRHARTFAFALISIDDWSEDTGTLAACAGRFIGKGGQGHLLLLVIPAVI